MIETNRKAFLEELRSGNRNKGTIQSDPKGNPVFVSETDKDGSCCCGVMAEMFGKTDTTRLSLPKAMKALGLTSADCKYIQTQISDTNTTLAENADRIEKEVFVKKKLYR